MEEFQKYRDGLATVLKDASKEDRRAILEKAKENPEYQAAKEQHLNEVQIQRSESAQTREKKLETVRAELEKPESIRTRVDMPHVDPISKLVERYFNEEGKTYDPEIIKDILYGFLEEGIEHSDVYHSEKYEAAFPWTNIDTAEIAKTLFAKYSSGNTAVRGEKGAAQVEAQPASKKKEFLFGSFQLVQNGNQFTFTEEILHQIMKELPQALEKIKRGEEPDSHEICVLGSPTNLLGTMSPRFLDNLKKNAFGTYGGLYAEFIEKQLRENSDADVLLYGISIGGSLASETARNLLQDKTVTQDRQESTVDHPFMQIRIDTPPGPVNKPTLWSKIKLYAGFGLEMGHELATNPYTRAVIFGDTKYIKQVNAVLAERGIKENMTPEQEKMKKEGISLVEQNLARGVPLDPGLKVTEVIGLKDLLTRDTEFNADVREQREENAGLLGMHGFTEGNERKFGADMGHAIPFVTRENEIKRMAFAVKSLQKLRDRKNQI